MRKFNLNGIYDVSGGHKGAIALHHKNGDVSLFELSGQYEKDLDTIEAVTKLAEACNGRITGWVDSDKLDSMWGYQLNNSVNGNLSSLKAAKYYDTHDYI